MRRWLGRLLTLAGALLLAFVATTYARGAVRQERARAQWEAHAAHAAALSARLAAAVPERSFLARGAPVARLRIPRIGLDEIVLEGVDGEELNAAPGHLPGSALPGERGNAIISAHRDRHFHHLGEVQVGDTIVTQVEDQPATEWIVVAKRVVGEREPALFTTTRPTLTLTTCWPLGYVGPAPDRLLLTAIPIEGHGQRNRHSA